MSSMTSKSQRRPNKILGLAIASALAIGANSSFGGVLTIEHVRKDTSGACLSKADGHAILASEIFLSDDPVIFPPFNCGVPDNLDNGGANGPVLDGTYDDGYFYGTYKFTQDLTDIEPFYVQFTLDNGAQFGKDISLAAGTALDFVAHPSGSHSNVSKESGGMAGDTEVTFYITPTDPFNDLNFDTLFMRFNMKNLGVLKVAGQEIKLGARVYHISIGEFDGSTTPVTVVTSVGDTVPPQLPPPQPPPQKLPPTLDLTVGFTGTGHGRITTDPSGIDCDSGKNQTQCSHSFKTATWVKLKVITDADSRLIRWFGNRSDCEDGEVFMSNSAICVAEVQLLPQQLTVNVTGQGNVSSIPTGLTCDDQCSHEFNGGEKVTLIATPKANWQLEKWQGDCDENGQVVLDKNQQCEAVFVKVPCSITPEQYWSSFYPYSPNFGTILVGDSIAVNQIVWFSTNQECGGPLYIDQDKIEVIGDNAAEFQVKDIQCYQYNWRDWWLNQSYSNSYCFFNTLFQPTVAGDKQAELTFKLLNYEELPIPTVALQAKAVDTGLAQLDLTPTEHDFGTAFIGRGSPQPQRFTLTNTGEISLKVGDITLTGDNAADFSLQSWWCNYIGVFHPGTQCYIDAWFSPTAVVAPKQAHITATAGNINTEALLTGVAEEPKNCSDANITIESVQSGHWNTASTWSTATLPTTTDVVRINSGHTVTGQAFAQVKTFCVQADGILKSANQIGTSLEIQATDYLENRGLIQGKDGANQTRSVCGKADIGTSGCAQPGANVILKVATINQGNHWWWWWYESGGPILNTGKIIAGKGGNGSQYGAPGGFVSILGKNVTNTNLIQAGNGGNILGTDTGQGGQGGATQIWSKLGGSGHLYNQNGAKILAGNGGNCNNPQNQQIGGHGGNIVLISAPYIHGEDGIIKAGTGGKGCSINGRDGWVIIDPSVISLAGAATQVSGGNVAIYGGNEWTLDLSNLSGPVVEATETITLAVGKDGIIDFRNSTGQILVAKEVQIFADNLRFDPDKFVSDYIAANNIIIGPSRILRNVSLSVAGKFFGNPGEVLSIPLIVANNGPETDKYTITATDSDGKILNQLIDVGIEGLETANLAIDITIPVSNKMIFTAVSQADSEISSTSEIILATPVISSDDDQVDSDDDITELNGNLPTQSGNQSTPDGNQSTPDGNQSTPDGNQSTPDGNQSTPDGNQSTPDGNQSTQGGNQSTQGGNQSTPDGDQVTNNDNQPTSKNNDVVIVDGPIINPCPVTSDGVIDWTCINKEQILTDMIFESNAKVSGGELAGTTDNQGLVSQVTIQPDALLKGGKLSGYIINHGTLKDFEFVGAQVIGGTLAGQVINNSSIGGVFKDVNFAADAHLIGGDVQGEIQGDPAAPALLENVTIRAGSHLAFVKIGKNVTWSADVVFEDSVEFIEPTTYCNSTQLTEMIPLLPSLDSIVFGNPPTPPCSQFMGGLSTDGKQFQRQLTVTRADAVEILSRIAPDLRHVNQMVDFVLSAAYRAVETEPPLYYMVDAQRKILPWDGKVSSLVAFRGQVRLELVQLLRWYHDQIPAVGSVAIQFGYRLADGTVVLNEPPLEVRVIE